MRQSTQLTLRLQPALGEIRRLGSALADFAPAIHLPEDRRFGLELALDELLTNTITYGYPGGPDGGITVTIRRDGDVVRVVMTDDAAPFDPFDAPPPDLESDLEDRPVGGLGIHFVRQFVDAFRYRYEAGRNIIELDVVASGTALKETE